MIDADFESILVPEDNGKQNLNDSYIKKYQKHVVCNNSYELVCFDDKFSKPFTEVMLFTILSIVWSEKLYTVVIWLKKYFSKELVLTRKGDEHFEDSTKCWICDKGYVDGVVKIRDHFHISGTHSCSAHRDSNIKVKLNHKIPIVFHNLKNYDSNLTVQELSKSNFKITSYALEKYMNFTINNRLMFIDSFQFLSSLLGRLVKNLCKYNFKYLSQESDRY